MKSTKGIENTNFDRNWKMLRRKIQNNTQKIENILLSVEKNSYHKNSYFICLIIFFHNLKILFFLQNVLNLYYLSAKLFIRNVLFLHFLFYIL